MLRHLLKVTEYKYHNFDLSIFSETTKLQNRPITVKLLKFPFK